VSAVRKEMLACPSCGKAMGTVHDRVAQLSFWKAVLALVIWPYFIGVLVR
jgi:hypothetical protein